MDSSWYWTSYWSWFQLKSIGGMKLIIRVAAVRAAGFILLDEYNPACNFCYLNICFNDFINVFYYMDFLLISFWIFLVFSVLKLIFVFFHNYRTSWLPREALPILIIFRQCMSIHWNGSKFSASPWLFRWLLYTISDNL